MGDAKLEMIKGVPVSEISAIGLMKGKGGLSGDCCFITEIEPNIFQKSDLTRDKNGFYQCDDSFPKAIKNTKELCSIVATAEKRGFEVEVFTKDQIKG